MRTSADVWVIDLAVLVGVAVVVPLALGGRWWRWWLGAAGVAVSFAIPAGPAAAVFVLPWLAVAGREAILRSTAALVPHRRFDDVGRAFVAVYGVVAAGALLASRGGWSGFGIDEPIVELTAVHYLYAGVAAVTLALWSCDRARSMVGRRAGSVAVVLTAAAPPIVALGFVIDGALPQVGGAVLLGIGVWITATLQLVAATRRGRPIAERLLLAVSGLGPWIPMVLAVTWAAGQHWDVPVLSIPDMARTHGAANAIRAVRAVRAGRRSARVSTDRHPVDPPAADCGGGVVSGHDVQMTHEDWLVAGSQRGAVLGALYPTLIAVVVSLASLVPQLLFLVVFVAPIGAMVGALVGGLVGVACGIVDGVAHVRGRRPRPAAVAVSVITTCAALLSWWLADSGAVLSLAMGPAAMGLISLAVVPLRPTGRPFADGSIVRPMPSPAAKRVPRCLGR